MTSEGWLILNKIHKNFDGVKVLDDVSCSVRQGEILGLIGPNGAGKTTLFNVITGFIPPNSGRVIFRGIDITGFQPHRVARLKLGRTFQNLRLIRQVSVLDNVLLSFRNQPGERIRNIFFKWRACKRTENDNRQKAIELLEQAGLVEKMNDPAEALSYGQQKLLSIVCCLASESDLLLLDEPVAGISPAMIEKILMIIQKLPKEGKSSVLIEHDMDVIMRICDRLIFMDSGALVCEGSPKEIRNDPRVIDAYID